MPGIGAGDSPIELKAEPLSGAPKHKRESWSLLGPWNRGDEQIKVRTNAPIRRPLGKPHINHGYLDYGTKLRRGSSWQ
jgi:hypothetical protein